MVKNKAIKKVSANGLTLYKVEGIEDKLFQNRESAKRALQQLKDTGFKSRADYRKFVLGE